MPVISPLVRHKARRAVLNAVFRVAKIAAAFIFQSIERTVAEKAVKILGFCRFVAREKLTVLVLKKFIIIHRKILRIVVK